MIGLNKEQIVNLTRQGMFPKYPQDALDKLYNEASGDSGYRLGVLLNVWKDPIYRLGGHPKAITESVLADLNVLDIASGSAYGWQPHFSRLCAINGAHVVALDIYPQEGIDKELFDWMEVDLIKAIPHVGLSSLPILAGRSFDIIYAGDFVGENPVPNLSEQLKQANLTKKQLESLLSEQTFSLLREGGIMTLGYRDTTLTHFLYHTKRNSLMVEIP